MARFQDTPFEAQLLAKLSGAGFTAPTPIQAQ
eukprot:COSAG01_NODE_37584_length_501_cov_2.559701_1_plen_31_part_01